MGVGEISEELRAEIARMQDEAQALLANGDVAGHERVLNDAATRLDVAVGPDHPLALELRYDAVRPLSQADDPTYVHKLLALYGDATRVHGPHAGLTQRTREKLANHFEAVGQYTDAARCAADMITSIEADDGDEVYIGVCLDRLSRNLEAAGDPYGAADACRRFIDLEARTRPNTVVGPLIRERLVAAEAEIARRHRAPGQPYVAGAPGWPAPPPPLAPPPPMAPPGSTFRLHRVVDYRAGVPTPNRFTPLLDPVQRRLVLAPGEQELWVHTDAVGYYALYPWENAPAEQQWDAPGPTVVVITTTRAALLCFRFLGEQGGRDYANRGVLQGTWTGIAASMASRRMENARASREEEGRVMALQLPFECISAVTVAPLAEPIDGITGGINLVLHHRDESHVVAYGFAGPLPQMRDHAHWVAGLVLHHRLAAVGGAALGPTDRAVVQERLAALAPEPMDDGELAWDLPAWTDAADLADARPSPPRLPPPPPPSVLPPPPVGAPG